MGPCFENINTGVKDQREKEFYSQLFGKYIFKQSLANIKNDDLTFWYLFWLKKKGK